MSCLLGSLVVGVLGIKGDAVFLFFFGISGEMRGNEKEESLV